MKKQPIIGITLDMEQPGEGKFSRQCPWYALRRNYSDAVAKHGALPVFLPLNPELAASYIDTIDGLMLSGGDFDIDPKLYGDKTLHPATKPKPERTNMEIALLKAAMNAQKPILGICGGQQLVSVVLGGNMYQHVPDVPGAMDHEQETLSSQAHHDITIVKGTRLHKIFGTTRLKVNSTHHQAVKTPGKGEVIAATAPDGIIEATELPDYPFCIGVQWHPEYEVNKEETALFAAFVAACAT